MIRKLGLPNGAYITNAYDSGGWLTNTVLKSSGDATLNFHGYNHDLAGQRTNQTRTLVGAATATSERVDYGYDNIGQLVTATGLDANGASFVAERNGYAYDSAGNLLRKTNDALVQTFGADADNQLTSVTRSGSTHVLGTTTPYATNVTVNGLAASLDTNRGTFSREGIALVDGLNTFTVVAQDWYGRKGTNSVSATYPATVSYSYDSNGNLTGDGHKQYSYDDEDRLIEVSIASQWRVQFAYDALSRRCVTTNFVWSGSSWQSTNETRYLYDGPLIVQERQFNAGQSTPRLTVTYTRGLDLSGSLRGAGGIGGLLAMSQLPNGGSQTHLFYHADGSGNVTALIDGSQQVVAQYQYDPFGNLLAQSGSQADANRYGFSSKERDPLSGLVLFEYRAYDPKLQRWLNRDPLGEAGGLNLYSYVANNPIAFTDDWGLDQHILNPNYGRPVFGATEPQPRFITVVTRNPPIVDFFADSFHDLFDYPGTGIVGGEFEGAALRASDDALPALIAEAERLFPKLCGKFHKHHIDPKYLGGDPKGPTATLPAPYHQLITSAFRREWPYGQGQPPLNVKLNILDAVYTQYPLPKK